MNSEVTQRWSKKKKKNSLGEQREKAGNTLECRSSEMGLYGAGTWLSE